MSVFADTSGFYAALDSSDRSHPKAIHLLADLISSGMPILTHNYVLVETVALLQHRLGLDAVLAFQEEVIPALEIAWLVAAEHAQAVESLLISKQRNLSLVDCASFLVMRKHGLKEVFAFDSHFVEQGFRCLG